MYGLKVCRDKVRIAAGSPYASFSVSTTVYVADSNEDHRCLIPPRTYRIPGTVPHGNQIHACVQQDQRWI
jgi:hypothetical protein